MQVATGKADVLMGEPAEVDAFIKNNPGKIRQIAGPPIRMQPSALQVATGEQELRNMLDGTLTVLQNNGYVSRLLNEKLGKQGHYYFLPAKNWRTEETN